MYLIINNSEWITVYNTELPDIRNILGWLTFLEAQALRMCTFTVSGLPGVIVEVGSYCGKSTVAIADMLKQGCSGTLYAVDSHVDNIEVYGVDSYKELQIQLQSFNVRQYVEVLKQTSADAAAEWQLHNIKMLFIDADHSYESVKQDFTLWEKFVIVHGLVIFHDSYEAGPQKVIEEAMETKKFHKLMLADSLTVLRKLTL